MATPHTIAVAGKGGVGKTTTCGMIIDYLCSKKNGPVLVVDADANANLNEVLGVEVETIYRAVNSSSCAYSFELGSIGYRLIVAQPALIALCIACIFSKGYIY